MKILAETKGEFQLVDFGHPEGQILPSHRPGVVESTGFIQMRLASGQINVLGSVTDEATDEEFLNYWRDSENSELAVSAFLASFEPKEASEKVAPVKGKGRV